MDLQSPHQESQPAPLVIDYEKIFAKIARARRNFESLPPAFQYYLKAMEATKTSTEEANFSLEDVRWLAAFFVGILRDIGIWEWSRFIIYLKEDGEVIDTKPLPEDVRAKVKAMVEAKGLAYTKKFVESALKGEASNNHYLSIIPRAHTVKAPKLTTCQAAATRVRIPTSVEHAITSVSHDTIDGHYTSGFSNFNVAKAPNLPQDRSATRNFNAGVRPPNPTGPAVDGSITHQLNNLNITSTDTTYLGLIESTSETPLTDRLKNIHNYSQIFKILIVIDAQPSAMDRSKLTKSQAACQIVINRLSHLLAHFRMFTTQESINWPLHPNQLKVIDEFLKCTFEFAVGEVTVDNNGRAEGLAVRKYDEDEEPTKMGKRIEVLWMEPKRGDDGLGARQIRGFRTFPLVKKWGICSCGDWCLKACNDEERERKQYSSAKERNGWEVQGAYDAWK